MSASSESEVEDPDEVEVPGGGRDLASLLTMKDDDDDPEVAGMLNLVKKAKKKRKTDDLLNTSGQSNDSLIMLVPNMFQLPGNNPKEEMKPNNNNGNINNNNMGFLPMNEESHEEEGMGVAETYADYKPRKVLIGVKHPDPVVESTSLAGVEPADVHYKVILPSDTISSGALSSLQLESITYASQQHEKILQDGNRAGFLVGDGAGVGKGRTIAGIIFENYLRKRKKAIWVSVLSDLKYDSERDLKDIGASNIKVYALNKMKYSKLSSDENGNITKGVIFCTYSSLIAKANQCNNNFKTRFLQLVDWCGPDFDGVVIFDECHRAKNLAPAGNSKPTKTGLAVLNLQKKLPNARVVYASATGATEPRNMAYMVRLGLWGPGTPFPDFAKFLSAMEMRGVGAMEILAMEMKQRGMYIARQLSFHGVSFRIVEVPLTDKFIKIYDRSTKLWTEALEKFKEAASLVSADKTILSSMWSLFWSAHQRFFKCLCIAAKVKEAVYISREAIKCGKCVVIGLQSTGEARLLEQMQKDEGELSDFVSSARGVLETLVEKHFPTDNETEGDSYSNDNTFNGFKRKPQSKPKLNKKRKILDSIDMMYSDSEGEIVNDYYDDDKSLCLKTSDNRKSSNCYISNSTNGNNAQTSWENSLKALELKKDLLAKIKKLGKKLPPNALDDLIDELGGPENVAEMTGRKGRVVQTDNGFHYESRSEADTPLEILNIVEKQRFMNGEKDVAIISEVASSGISLHSDRRAANRKSRVHITLELPWSADRAIQQFGRTHRSNQASAPEYVFLISDLAGERRFASVVAKRLESLGALTHGDRRATETRDLSRFNIDNNYGRTAMEVTLKTLVGSDTPRVPFPKNYEGNFVQDACKALASVGLLTKNENNFILANERRSLSRFLNRLLGLPVKLQNCLFDYFTATMEAIIAEAKKMGVYDVGILDLAGNESNVKRLGSERFRWLEGTGEVVVDLHKILVERGMAWAQVLSLWHSLGEEDGDFWLSQQVRGGKREVIMAVAVKRTEKRGKERAYIIYRPNIGEQVKRESNSWLESRFKSASREEAEIAWKDHYEGSARACSHEHWGGRCSVRSAGETCDHGLRQRVYHVISGSVLRLWPTLESILSHKYGNTCRLQVIRISTCDGAKIVGTLIPTPCVAPLHNALSKLASQRQLL